MTALLAVILAVGVTVFGPLTLFAGGADAWLFAATVAGLAAACSYVSRLTRRRWPDSEWFAVWLFMAAIIWGGSGWLGIALLAV